MTVLSQETHPPTRGNWLAPTLLAGALLVALVQTLRSTWLSDDLFITLRYCDNLLDGLGAVYNPSEHVEGYSHFLWFLILTIGRALTVPPEILGRFLGLPFFLGSIVLLYRLGRRLIPASRRSWAVPVAAVGWALMQDAQLYSSGGLETPFFTFLLLLGFDLATRPQGGRWLEAAGATFALATLTRPEGLLMSIIAVVGVGILQRRWGAALRFAVPWLLLWIPHQVFRLAYYGHWFPNTFYAKSATLPYWSQGLWYLWTWIYVYPVLTLVVVATVFVLWKRLHGDHGREPLLLGAALGWVGYVGVTRGGGDYMFGRFFLPFTPFLWLLMEDMLAAVSRRAVHVTASLVVCLSLWSAPPLRAVHLSNGRYWGDVADEPRLGTLAAWERNRRRGRVLATCLEGSGATVTIMGGQCVLGYYGRFPRGIEEHGLTDERIAHYPIEKRSRPGHEKLMTTAEVFERPVHFRLHYARLRNAPYHTSVVFRGDGEEVFGEILVYDEKVMTHLADCGHAQFVDFPLWLRRNYIPQFVPRELPSRLLRDYEHFLLYYFQQNPGTQDLLEELQRALETRGLKNLDQVHPVPRVIGFDENR
jgi:hypothetical protein